MLERVDRIQLAVADAAEAARTFQEILGAEPAREEASDYLNARRTVLALGASEVELCEPLGPGIVRAHLDRWGPGLLTAGFSVASVAALRAHLFSEGVEFTKEGEQTYLEPTVTAGMRVVVSPAVAARRLGLVSHLYEVTNTLVSPWEAAAERYTRLFGLDPSRFSPIASERFGYTGTLTLFDPPARLDRIEISQVTRPDTAMGRWAAKRGDSLYMCYAETEDVGAIVRRLTRRQARFTPRGGDPLAERDGLWIHPSALGGLLLGISRTTVAWEWSGRPERVVH
ncbi:MAG TPA: VOC family protein [Candidatus Nitrosotalea sp.]|jgi:catechol 2,3-dioxygenase-like lactoylglutathione lyase family enzyme|nr:VOC family protein [Candidatus Nitrosotalea sp.]